MQSTSTPPSGRGPMAAALATIVITGGLLAWSWFKAPRPTVDSGDAPTAADARPRPAPDSGHTAVEPVAVNQHENPPAASEPLFEGWDGPAAVLVFTGEQHGFLEPCGCTSGQTGGLARRADLMRTLRQDRQWPTAGLDLGGQLRDERAKRPQEQLKFETTRAALKLMDFDLAGLGPEELRFGADSLYTLFSEEQTKGDVSPQFVCSNVSLFEPPGPDYQLEIPAPFRMLQVGDLKVGVTSIVGARHWAKVFGADQTVDQTLFGYVDAAEALERVLPLMQAEQPDVLVLLSHADVEQSRQLAERFGDFDVVVTAGGPEDGREKAEQVNNTLLLQVGHKGKHAGVIGVFPEGTEPRLRFELVELNGEQFSHSPVIHELLEAYVAELDAQHPNLQETSPWRMMATYGAEYAAAAIPRRTSGSRPAQPRVRQPYTAARTIRITSCGSGPGGLAPRRRLASAAGAAVPDRIYRRSQHAASGGAAMRELPRRGEPSRRTGGRLGRRRRDGGDGVGPRVAARHEGERPHGPVPAMPRPGQQPAVRHPRQTVRYLLVAQGRTLRNRLNRRRSESRSPEARCRCGSSYCWSSACSWPG